MINLIPQFDVIIIGSGPSGCAASINCVQAGLSVLLITDQKNEHNKLKYFESVHSGIYSILLKLKATNCLTNSSFATYEGIQTGNIFLNLGSDENGAWLGHHIDKSIFNSNLLQCASKQGVSIIFDEIIEDLIIQDEYVIGVTTNSGKKNYSKICNRFKWI